MLSTLETSRLISFIFNSFNLRKMADGSRIEFIPANKKVEASTLHDNGFLENSFLKNLMLVMSY